MSYTSLLTFNQIIKRKDLEYISDLTKIKQVCDLIRYSVKRFEDHSQEVRILNTYWDNLNSFYKFAEKSTTVELTQGYELCIKTFIITTKLLNEKDENKINILSSKYPKRFMNDFLSGLSLICEGLRKVFSSETISAIGLSKEQLINYILDGNEGLGKRFKFNTKGEYAFTKRVNKLEIRELLSCVKLLTNSKELNQKKNTWIVLGKGSGEMRILLDVRRLKKDKIYYLFKPSEHDEYLKTLHNTRPDKQSFVAA